MTIRIEVEGIDSGKTLVPALIALMLNVMAQDSKDC